MTPSATRVRAPLAVSATTLLALVLSTLSILVASPAGATTNGTMVSFGDSVPSGARCECTPFPQQYAAMVARHTGRRVQMINDAVGGATSASVLRQLQSSSVRAAVRSSATVLVMTGANDFVAPFRSVLWHQRRARVVFPAMATTVRNNVAQIVRTLHQLRPGIRVLVADYWNVVKDGAVGRRDYGPWGVRKAAQATAYANRALAAAARAQGATLVSTYVPFDGRYGHRDPTPLLAADGDHPDARGHTVIARAFFRHADRG